MTSGSRNIQSRHVIRICGSRRDVHIACTMRKAGCRQFHLLVAHTCARTALLRTVDECQEALVGVEEATEGKRTRTVVAEDMECKSRTRTAASSE